MNTRKRYTIIGIIFVLITGTISHFVYGWSGNNFILGLIFPINESTWEHMKLCFFPLLFYSFYMGRKTRREYPGILSSLLFGILLGTFSIPVFFYTYTGILGQNFFVFDILTFAASVLLAFAAVYRFSLSYRLIRCTLLLKISVIILALCFFVFTYYPLPIGIFADPTK